MRFKHLHFGWKLLAGGLALLAATGLYAGWLVARHNLHTVTPGVVYRSSRMDPQALAAVIQARALKSVLSLVGSNHDEYLTARRWGAAYYAVSLSDRHEVTDAQMNTLLAMLRQAPKPVLIHCKAGADRTGLAAALYHYAIQGESADDASGELTLCYGHLPAVLGLGTSAMDRSYWSYVRQHAPGDATNLP